MYLKLTALFLLISMLLPSCEENSEISPDKKLQNCAIDYLYFKDNHLFRGRDYGFPAAEPLELKVRFEYENGKIVKSTGGFLPVPDGMDLTKLIFSSDLYDSIVHQNNTLKVYTKPEVEYVLDDEPSNPIIYKTDKNNRLQKVIRRDSTICNYFYRDNLIIEKDSENNIRRKFYFENNNLVKVETEDTNSEGVVDYRKKILFQDYDNNPNPLKNKYHILGAFYRAFSENNYEDIQVYEYERRDGEMKVTTDYWYEIPIDYDDGYPKFGDYL
ncbi:MAG: hypothetical protein K9I68_03135 [Bacteroidales bacterium]|nr:hypothetical protein [Bacteroidales bacterium]MCF8336851.1 hypothetical protein [Bacteroidales bacterium]